MRRDTPKSRAFAAKRSELRRDPDKPLKRADRRPRRRRAPQLPAATKALKRQLEEAWGEHARAGVCAVCGRRCGVVRGHHVIEKQLLRRQARTLGLDAEETLRILWDRRNLLRVGDVCHHRHHFGMRATVTRAVVDRHCPRLPEFLDEFEVGWALDYYYPREGR